MKLRICFALFPLALCVNAFAQPGIHERAPRVPRYVTVPYKPLADLAKAVAPATTVPMWTATSGTYNYQMVGQSPYTALASPSTTIAAPIIPLILTFSDGTVFDPTVKNGCSSAGSAVSLLEASPIFTNSTYTVGGTSVGSTLYHDFFQRANFWQYTKPGGVNPNYHLLLSGSTGTAVKITVPAANGQTVTESCGKMGEVSLPWLDNYLLTTGFTQLASNGVLPSQLPVFLLSNVAMYESTAADCCALGFHSAFDNPNYSNTLQTFVVGDFDTTGIFGATTDASPLSHEIGEWMNDPLGNNPTPAWGHTGEITGCSSLLEVGDPLTGTDTTITMSNNFKYHVQELAFFSWFYRQSPSIGINGWYSSNGTFKTYSAPCNPTTTTLSISPTTLSVGGSVTVKATVSPASGTGTPTGTVALVSSTGTTIGTYALSAGAVSTTSTGLPAGTYTVTANYSGDASFSASSSAAVSITVGSPSVVFSPISLTFASQAVATSSAAQSVKLTNDGTAALTGIVVSVGGASPGDYSQTNTCGTTVAMGANCSIAVIFKPTAAGSRTATVSVADNAGGSPQTVALSGTGAAAAPAVSLSATSLAFGNVTTGSKSAAQKLTLTNSGAAALSITSVSISGANAGDFGEATTCSGSIAAKATCTVTLTFTPTAIGARTGIVALADNATGSPQSVALSGTGISPVTLSASSLAFGSVTSGAKSTAQTVTITNSGAASLGITSVTVTGTGSKDFTSTSTCGSSLASGANCAATVTFTPASKAVFTATLSISDNAVGSPQMVTLTGTGK